MNKLVSGMGRLPLKYKVGFVVLLLGLVVPVGIVLADGAGTGACPNISVGSITGSDDLVTYDASPNTISAVCIKSGSNMFGGNQHSGPLGNGTYENGCYQVSGVGTSEVTVTRLGEGSNCQAISHIDVIFGGGDDDDDTADDDDDVTDDDDDDTAGDDDDDDVVVLQYCLDGQRVFLQADTAGDLPAIKDEDPCEVLPALGPVEAVAPAAGGLSPSPMIFGAVGVGLLGLLRLGWALIKRS